MQPLKIDKKALVTLILKALNDELTQAINAANAAHAAAIDDQSIAETQYDTLAIEASYLAEGQSRRVEELQAAINNYQILKLIAFNNNMPISLSALVQLSADSKSQHWFFIAPAAGGFRCQQAGQHITVITPQSPMGQALMNKFEDDDVEVMLNKQAVQDSIEKIL
ncbi:MAG: hypothetical protein QF552_12005 [Litorilituus sp.]|jgi:transcription elongation GreA/GreB family factor|nr:hypothetical protein [Litorilituus sp.]